MLLPAMLALLAAAAPPAPSVPSPSSLGSHAAAWAKSQGAGAVVVAEKAAGRWTFALGGEPFAAGHAAVPPERIEFEIGSISKLFTGLLLAHAVAEGKLALTDTLAARLPAPYASADVGGITLKQLATHTSCLPRMPTNVADADPSDPFARYDDAALLDYLEHARLDKKPPCDAAYSNLGFGTLGVVLERAYGKRWENLVREKITGPLDMGDTVQVLSDAQKERFAEPWAGAKPAHPWNFKAGSAAGALRSTAADMAKFADALLAGAGGPLKDVWPIFAGDEVEAPGLGGRIALALLHDRVDGEDSYWHDGGTGGFRSLLRVFPAGGRAVVVLASNAAADPDAWLAAWRAEGRTPVERKEIVLPPASLDDYPGTYVLSAQARFTVLRVGDGLRVRLTGQPFLALFPSAKDEFFLKAVDAQISFRRDPAGKIAALTLHQNGRDQFAARNGEPPPHVEFPPVESLEALEGTYDFGAFAPGATITVKRLGDALGAQLTGQPMFPVFAVGSDRFEYDVVPASLTFERDADGKIVAVVLRQNGATMRAPRK